MLALQDLDESGQTGGLAEAVAVAAGLSPVGGNGAFWSRAAAGTLGGLLF